jgi:SAM-dependent methyltransferase
MVGQTLTDFMDANGYLSLLDIGCGDGRLLMRLAQKHPNRHFVGIESAPVLFLIAYWRSRKQPNCQIKFGDFWKISWAPFDVVFAFLSPEPMLWVWRKAERDMRENSALLSLAFTVPGIEEDSILPAQQFDLFLYQHRTRRLHHHPDKKNDSQESV